MISDKHGRDVQVRRINKLNNKIKLSEMANNILSSSHVHFMNVILCRVFQSVIYYRGGNFTY